MSTCSATLLVEVNMPKVNYICNRLITNTLEYPHNNHFAIIHSIISISPIKHNPEHLLALTLLFLYLPPSVIVNPTTKS